VLQELVAYAISTVYILPQTIVAFNGVLFFHMIRKYMIFAYSEDNSQFIIS